MPCIGLIVSGGSDKFINVYDPLRTEEPTHTLIGHTENVCALTTTPSGHIVSGSWDTYVYINKYTTCLLTIVLVRPLYGKIFKRYMYSKDMQLLFGLYLLLMMKQF